VTADHHPRYVIRELTGYSLGIGHRRPTTDVWVADTWYCWKEVARFMTPGYKKAGHPNYPVRRAMAEAVCARLNAEHEAWLLEDVA
jgi:hypothetical protein